MACILLGIFIHFIERRSKVNTPSRMPSLRSLRAFTYAARHMSFKLAAEQLCLSASAVSHQVRNLEEFLGVPLFTRKTRALEFTEAGKKYFDFLDSMFARLEMETFQLRSEFGRVMIRLCVPPFFANELLVPKMDALQSILPAMDVRMTTQTSLMKAHPAEADLSILLGDEDDWPDLVTHKLFTRRLVVAAAPALLEGFDRESYDDLNGKTLIVHENRPNAWSNWAKALDIPSPQAGSILRFDSMSSVAQSAARGLGFAIVSWPLSRAWFESGALERVYETEWVTDEHFFLAHRPVDADRPELQKVVDWFMTELRQDG